jgi:hypothetical protein
MAQEALTLIKDYLAQGRAFEVKLEADRFIVNEAKGITKVSISSEELKGAKIRKAIKRKIPKEQISIITNIAEIFLKNSVSFKVIFGSDESTIRLDLDHYIRLIHDKVTKMNRCIVVGFKNIDEYPIGLIKERLSIYSNVKLLSPMR